MAGHQDKFMCFITTGVKKEGKKDTLLLLVHPSSCYKLFKKFEELFLRSSSFLKKPKRTSSFITGRRPMPSTSCWLVTTWGTEQLHGEMHQPKPGPTELGAGPDECDIIEVSQLFILEQLTNTDYSQQTDKLFVRLHFSKLLQIMVMGKNVSIFKSLGPQIHGICCLEKRICQLLEPLDLKCTFIDTLLPDGNQRHLFMCQHLQDALCLKWWQMVPATSSNRNSLRPPNLVLWES